MAISAYSKEKTPEAEKSKKKASFYRFVEIISLSLIPIILAIAIFVYSKNKPIKIVEQDSPPLFQKTTGIQPEELVKTAYSLNKIEIEDSSYYQYHIHVFDTNREVFSKELLLNSEELRSINGLTASYAGATNMVTGMYGVDGNPLQDVRLYLNLLKDSTKIKVSVNKLKQETIHNSKEVGDLEFAIDDTMMVNEPYQALLLIARGTDSAKADDIISRAYQGQQEPSVQRDSTLVTKKMLARLTDPGANNFKVDLTDNDSVKQIDFNKTKYTVWEWTVTPLKEGDNNLFLTISQVIDSGSEGKEFIPSKKITVHVYSIKKPLFERIIDFITQEWKYFAGAVATALTWIFARMKRKKAKSQVPDPTIYA